MNKTARRILTVLLTAALLMMPLSLGAGAEKALIASPDAPIKVACVGCSTTVGVGSSSSSANYPAVLQKLLGAGYEVRNFGYNATTAMKDGLDGGEKGTPAAYVDCPQYQPSLDYQPDIVVLMLGGNDTKPENWKGGKNSFKADYKELVQTYLALDSHPTVLVVGDIWVCKSSWGINDNDTVNGVFPAEKAVAEELSMPFIDLHTPTMDHPEYYIEDGVHMSDAGYNAIATLIAGKLTDEVAHQPHIPEITDEPITVACVGASTTTGTKGHSYPTYLQGMLGGGYKVYNFGYPGTSVTKNRDFSYFGSSYYTDSLALKADIVIIDLGANDCQPAFWDSKGNGTFQKDFEEIVNAYRNQGNDPLILISTGGYCRLPDGQSTMIWGHDDNVLATRIQPMQEAVAKKYNLPTADLRKVLMSDPDGYIDGEDGVHYTAAGYKAMAQLYYDALMDVMDVAEDTTGRMWNPATVSDPTLLTKDELGRPIIQWSKGQKGYFSYDSGSFAMAMGIEEGTVLKELSITVSYYWDYAEGGNDWWQFNTTDKDGLSAPGIENGNPHDNGFGLFSQYGMVKNQWAELTVTRQEQTLGGAGADWSVNVGDLNAQNSLTINGFIVKATLPDGTEKVAYWGIYPPVDCEELEKMVGELDGKLSQFYTRNREAFAEALAKAKEVLADPLKKQRDVDGALAALKNTRANVWLYGDVDEDGALTTTDARLTLQYAAEKIDGGSLFVNVADVDGDGDETTTDARLILQKAAGKIEDLPTPEVE